MIVTKKPIIASLLSLIIPGLGQLYCGRNTRGAAILSAAIIIGNLNLLFLILFLETDLDAGMGWAYWIPRVGHDVVSIWSIAFWLWLIIDAYRCAKKPRNVGETR
jgi:TM2 domain-containing membrane protein YozV